MKNLVKSLFTKRRRGVEKPQEWFSILFVMAWYMIDPNRQGKWLLKPRRLLGKWRATYRGCDLGERTQSISPSDPAERGIEK